MATRCAATSKSGRLAIFSMKHSTLYPILHRLEKDGLLKSEWCTEGVERPRKTYRLTTDGRKHYEKAAAQWRAFLDTMNLLIPEEDSDV